MYTINFLQHRQRQLNKLETQDKGILKIAAIVFGVAALVTSMLLGARFYFFQKLTAAETREKQLQISIGSQERTEEAFLFFINKLDSLEKLFNQRKNKQDAIEYFSQVFGPAVTLENIAFNAQEGSVEFGLKAATVFTLDSVFETLSSTDTTSRFKTVTKQDLRRGEDGRYGMQVIVTFADDKTGT